MVVKTEDSIVVVGGGPAGLSAAIALRLKGFTVTVIDFRQPPIKKACGEGILPHGIKALKYLGVHIDDDKSFHFSGIRFIDNELIAEGSFSGNYGVGIERSCLHEKLMERAQELGVNLLWHKKIQHITNSIVQFDNDSIKYSYLIGADGAASKIRRLGKFKAQAAGVRRVGLQRHYDIAPWSRFVEVYSGLDSQAFITPVSERKVCVALIGERPSFDFKYLNDRFPTLAQKLIIATGVGEILGGVSQSTRLEKVVKENIVLIGDASFSIDSITGDGLSLAFCQAIALANAFNSDDILSYNRMHRSLIRMPVVMEKILLFMSRHKKIRRSAIKALNRDKQILDNLLSIHTGNKEKYSLIQDVSRLALRMTIGIYQ
jgi:menaquinone-9 beta-reductase